jgi:hypothetical protein
VSLRTAAHSTPLASPSPSRNLHPHGAGPAMLHSFALPASRGKLSTGNPGGVRRCPSTSSVVCGGYGLNEWTCSTLELGRTCITGCATDGFFFMLGDVATR